MAVHTRRADNRRFALPVTDPAMLHRLLNLATALAIAGLVACAQLPPPAAPGPVFAPNANLVAQGIPAIPQSLVDRVQKYTDFRGHGFVDWHPVQRQMLVAHRKAGDTLTQLYLLRSPLAAPEQLTADAEPVSSASFEPREGRSLVFARSSGGNEAAQLYRMDLATRQVTLLTDPDYRNEAIDWLRRGSQLLYSAVPLDRTAQGGRRAEVTTTYWLIDPSRPETRRKVAELPGGGWFGGNVSPDDRQIAVTRYLSANESQVWLIDLATGARRQLLPAPGDSVRSTHFAGDFTPDGRSLQFVSDRAGEFREAMLLDLASGEIRRLSAHVPWDVSGGTATRDGRLVAMQFNVDGSDELRLFDAANGFKELPAPRIPSGNVGVTNFHPAGTELAFTLNSAQGPSQIYKLDVASGRVEPWTRAEAAAGMDMGRFGDQQIIRWTSFDGRRISGLLNPPPARFTGKRPVIIDIHGGPEAQARVGFMGRYNYFVQELGVAIIQPNVRGSSGFGKTFLALDNGMLREDSVKDIGALLDWIAQQPGLDASRVLVSGGSYGGYMSLAVSVHYPDRIAGAVDDVGISHFVTFLNNTESYRRDLRRVEYGDERDPAMREFLDRISPLTNAHRIRKPLFVVQGKNDPRVPYTEAEQIVERVRANGTPVWYLRAENEGHGFARKENADFRFYAMVKFVEDVLLK
jgi:dipeptidyl aminopeptidase/acylaminoacyl peptidase